MGGGEGVSSTLNFIPKYAQILGKTRRSRRSSRNGSFAGCLQSAGRPAPQIPRVTVTILTALVYAGRVRLERERGRLDGTWTYGAVQTHSARSPETSNEEKALELELYTVRPKSVCFRLKPLHAHVRNTRSKPTIMYPLKSIVFLCSFVSSPACNRHAMLLRS